MDFDEYLNRTSTSAKEHLAHIYYFDQQRQNIEATEKAERKYDAALQFREAIGQEIAKLTARAEEAEARCETLGKMVKGYQDELIPGYRERAEKAEKKLKSLSTVVFGKPIMTTGQREVITFCGVPVEEAMGRVVDYPILEEKLEKAERCIGAIEDDLDRGNDNDWAREHIAEWRKQEG